MENMKLKRIIDCKTRVFAACAVAVMAWAMMMAVPAAYAQPDPAILSPELQEIVRFTQAHMTDEVIVAYIRTSGKNYYVSGDALLVLNSMGVSQPVLGALLATPQTAPPPAAVAPPAPPETPTIDYFQAHLTPYGQWIDVPDVGAAWVPAEANNPGWRPYMDAGHWQFTDAGWFWQSDYAWGDMAFHYGRWINSEFTGGRWAWVPGYNWAPSWVSWREGAGGLGWAPLPWGVEFRPGLGLYWHGALAVGGIDFGLGFGAFVFVGTDHFWGGNYRTYVFDDVRSREFFVHSTFHSGYQMQGGHLVAEGLGRDHMSQITHHQIVVQKATELRRTEEHHDFATRTQEHHELARVTVHAREPARPEASRSPAAREHAPGTAAERTSVRPGSENGAARETPGHPGSATGAERETPGRAGSATGAERETPGRPGSATGAERETPGRPGSATGAPREPAGRPGSAPGGAKVPPGHAKPDSAGSKPPEKRPDQ
jgi:hypothetical protein